MKLRKGLSSRFWEKVVLALIGEQFDVGNEICGAVIQIRHYEDTISIWNRNASRTDMTNKIKYVAISIPPPSDRATLTPTARALFPRA